ncbi:MAG: hypothetical protein H6707_14555 [Deltaproteobacteria bacterium]|nr:hypothetical protein [Deltaproteobacteria bacterium]
MSLKWFSRNLSVAPFAVFCLGACFCACSGGTTHPQGGRDDAGVSLNDLSLLTVLDGLGRTDQTVGDGGSPKADGQASDARQLPDLAANRDGATAPPDALLPIDQGITSTDPFSAASCSGTPMLEKRAALLLAGAVRTSLGQATLMVRRRSCSDPSTCGRWQPPVAHQQVLVTYSGGVTTRRKTFAFPTELTLWRSASLNKVTVQHRSEVLRCPNCTTPLGMTFAFGQNPATATYPRIRIYDPAPQSQWDYTEFDIAIGRDANLFVGYDCARFWSLSYDGTEEFAALYRF